MAVKTILFKRGTDAQRQAVTPGSGEAIWTTDLKELWLGDGVTAGGIKVVGAVETALGNYIPLTQKGAANGVAPLDASSKIDAQYLPAIAITETFVVASEAEQLALTAQEGDVAIRSDLNRSYIHNGGTAGTMADWNELLTPTDAVLSVNGQTGAVVLTTTNIAEGTNLYFTDGRADARVQAAIQDTVTSSTTLWSSTKISSELATVQGLIITSFVGLSDTPANYTGAGSFTVKVNSGGTGLEFVDESVIDGGTL